MSSICADFDKLKRKVLVSILLLSVSDEYLLDYFIWESCQLKPSDGGIGMIQSGQILLAALLHLIKRCLICCLSMPNWL